MGSQKPSESEFVDGPSGNGDVLVYLSSTFDDLEAHRRSVLQSLRQLNYRHLSMEDYVAENRKAVTKCLSDVRTADVYVGLFAYRYGFVPEGYSESITALEYRQARREGIPCFIFLLDDRHDWPVCFVDSDRGLIDQLREELQQTHMAGRFTTPDDLALKLTAALVGSADIIAQRRRKLLSESSVAKQETASSPRDAGPVSPIIIAIEAEKGELDAGLLASDRHLSVSLSDTHLRDIEQTCEAILGRLGPHDAKLPSLNGCFDDLKQFGLRVFAILESAEPRLRDVIQRIVTSGRPQPVAWAATPETLDRIAIALQILTFATKAGPDVCLSASLGAPYFLPVQGNSGLRYRLPRRKERAPKICVVEKGSFDDSMRSELASKSVDLEANTIATICHSDVILNRECSSSDVTKEILIGIKAQSETSPTRLWINLVSELTPRQISTEVLPWIPCYSSNLLAGRNRFLASKSFAAECLKAMNQRLDRKASPDVLAEVRRAVCDDATLASAPESVAALFLACWTWTGKPLFSRDFSDLQEPACDHLLDLRRVASKEWYYDRKDISPKCYTASSLSSKESSAHQDQSFHLYLTGAGGSGKSCFLRYIFDVMNARSDVIAVWHRVDTPSSEWIEIEQKVVAQLEPLIPPSCQEECESLFDGRDVRLRELLPQLVKILRNKHPGFSEIAIFIDQLERSFESGEMPEPSRLERVSYEARDLLTQVGVGQGVRVFLASRKQYLPDFAGSFQDLQNTGLHFFVLQPVNNSSDKREMLKSIVRWCREKRLIAGDVEITDAAAELLATKANGIPLDMVLSLIRLLSDHDTVRIEERLLEERIPWSKRFDDDLASFRNDPLDWYVLLAVAHARTEIVKLDQIWWRLRLVNPEIAARAEELGQLGVIEKLWHSGGLGRTIFGRPDVSRNRIGYIEFFHANLRDFLLENYLPEMPVSWRALDRLFDAAQEWQQNHRVLSTEDTTALMQNREALIDGLELLFSRVAEDHRQPLIDAAGECLAVSALVHSQYGDWALKHFFKSPETRIAKLVSWLRGCPASALAVLVRCLVAENSSVSRELLVEIILGRDQNDLPSHPADSTVARMLTEVLAIPLYSTRYRAPIVTAVLDRAYSLAGNEWASQESVVGQHVREFLARAANGDGEELRALLCRCEEEIRGGTSVGADRLADAISANENLAFEITATQSNRSRATGPFGGRYVSPSQFDPILEMAIGSDLTKHIDEDFVGGLIHGLKERWGVPLPNCVVVPGEKVGLKSSSARLSIHGIAFSTADFYWDRNLLLRDDLGFVPSPRASEPDDTKATTSQENAETNTESSNTELQDLITSLKQKIGSSKGVQREPPASALPGWHLIRKSPGLWIDPTELLSDEEPHAEPASKVFSSWFEDSICRSIDDIFGLDLVREFLILTHRTNLAAIRDLLNQVSLDCLRRVIVNLLRQNVSLASRQSLFVERLKALSTEGFVDADLISEKIRIIFGRMICDTFATDEGQIYATAFHASWEIELEQALRRIENNLVLILSPKTIQRLVVRHRDAMKRIWQKCRHPPVLICGPGLRLPLYRLLEQFDSNTIILSYAELLPDFNVQVLETIGTQDDPLTVVEGD